MKEAVERCGREDWRGRCVNGRRLLGKSSELTQMHGATEGGRTHALQESIEPVQEYAWVGSAHADDGRAEEPDKYRRAKYAVKSLYDILDARESESCEEN